MHYCEYHITALHRHIINQHRSIARSERYANKPSDHRDTYMLVIIHALLATYTKILANTLI